MSDHARYGHRFFFFLPNTTLIRGDLLNFPLLAPPSNNNNKNDLHCNTISVLLLRPPTYNEVVATPRAAII